MAHSSPVSTNAQIIRIDEMADNTRIWGSRIPQPFTYNSNRGRQRDHVKPNHVVRSSPITKPKLIICRMTDASSLGGGQSPRLCKNTLILGARWGISRFTDTPTATRRQGAVRNCCQRVAYTSSIPRFRSFQVRPVLPPRNVPQALLLKDHPRFSPPTLHP